MERTASSGSSNSVMEKVNAPCSSAVVTSVGLSSKISDTLAPGFVSPSMTIVPSSLVENAVSAFNTGLTFTFFVFSSCFGFSFDASSLSELGIIPNPIIIAKIELMITICVFLRGQLLCGAKFRKLVHQYLLKIVKLRVPSY